MGKPWYLVNAKKKKKKKTQPTRKPGDTQKTLPYLASQSLHVFHTCLSGHMLIFELHFLSSPPAPPSPQKLCALFLNSFTYMTILSYRMWRSLSTV